MNKRKWLHKQIEDIVKDWDDYPPKQFREICDYIKNSINDPNELNGTLLCFLDDAL